MSLFRKREAEKFDFSVLKADMHSHLLPDIDDGSPDLDTSLALIKGMHDLGYKKLITTPHILWDVYKNTPAIILEKLSLVRAKLKGENIDVDLQAAAEYFIDDHLAELLEKKEPLLTFGNKMVLVEFSMVSHPFQFRKIFFELQIQGYQPVLAHPERYTYLERNLGFYDELKEAGYLFQMNVLSLQGHYGNSVMNLAKYLAKKQYYDLIGSDLHHMGHLDALNNLTHGSAVQRVFDSGKILNPQL